MLLRGDIALVNFDPAELGEAASVRPAIIITNNVANLNSPVLVVIPLTTAVNRVYPFELLIASAMSGLPNDSKAQTQLIRHVSLRRIGKVIGRLEGDVMQELERRLMHHLGLG